jgi:hypothetical protein
MHDCELLHSSKVNLSAFISPRQDGIDVISRVSVSLIMCTGGAYRPFLHDRHFSAASSFQIGVPRPADGVEWQARSRLASIAFDLEPGEPAVEALPDRRRWLRRPAVPLHSD